MIQKSIRFFPRSPIIPYRFKIHKMTPITNLFCTLTLFDTRSFEREFLTAFKFPIIIKKAHFAPTGRII